MAPKTVVIGGGPAGSAAAIQLARAGRRVCLLERKRAAHHKLCGEFISWEAAHYLKELGIDLAALGAVTIRRVRLVNGDTAVETGLPFRAWSLSRRRLDAALLQKAEQAGALLWRGVAVRNLSRLKDGWVLDTSDPGGTLSTLDATTVFLASGKHDVRNWGRVRPPQSRALIGLKMHLRLNEIQQNQLRETVEVHLFNGGYAGLEPVEEGKVNLCFLIHKDIFNGCGKNWSALLAWLADTSPHMRARLAGSDSLWSQPLAVYGTPYGFIYRSTAATPGLFRLGDQMAVIPSFAGDGIAIALHSGFLAAHVHSSGGESQRYHWRARKDFQRPVRNARILAGLLSHTRGKRLALSLSRLYPGAAKQVVSAVRLTRVELVSNASLGHNCRSTGK